MGSVPRLALERGRYQGEPPIATTTVIIHPSICIPMEFADRGSHIFLPPNVK